MNGEPTVRSPRPLLLFGGSGQVGRELRRTLASLGDVIAPTHADVDLTQPEMLRDAIARIRPAVVVNCAALTNVDQAEREPSLAHAVNAVAPGVMAEASRNIGALVVHYSTDYVFDGTTSHPYDEDARPNPINAYGASKLGGERRVAEAGVPHLIIRTSWVYSATGSGFVATLLRDLSHKDTVRVVSDQVGSPTWSVSLAYATTEILQRLFVDGTAVLDPVDWGIYHLGGSGEASRVAIAEVLFDTLRTLDAETHVPRIVPISASEFAAAAPRPHYSALSNRRTERRFGVRLEPWRSELRRMVLSRAD